MTKALMVSFLILFSACGKKNSTSTDLRVRKNFYNPSAYLTIKHHSEDSILRRKLLNSILDSRIEINPKLVEKSLIADEDEFKFSGEKTIFSNYNIEEYKNLSENSAKLIVSFEDRLEIYFLPSGILKEKVLSDLHLEASEQRHFDWIQSDVEFLTKGKIYYLVSSKKTDLLDNDIYFHNQFLALGESFNEKIFTFSKYQVLELKLAVDYIEKEVVVSTLRGQSIKCTKDMREAGMCDPCFYKIEVLSGQMVKNSLETTQLIDFDIHINGKKYSLADFHPVKEKNGSFKILIDLKKILTDEFASVQFTKNAQPTVTKVVRTFEETSMCAHHNVESKFDITPSVNMNLDLNVRGRTLKL
jgi:hypothetical protein